MDTFSQNPQQPNPNSQPPIPPAPPVQPALSAVYSQQQPAPVIEDIFDSDPSVSPQQQSMGPQAQPQPQSSSFASAMDTTVFSQPQNSVQSTVLPPQGQGKMKRIIVLTVIVLFFVSALSVAGWVIFNKQSTPQTPLDTLNHVQPVENTNTNSNTNAAVTNTTKIVDSDGDGLIDSEEQQLKTNPEAIDSDQDGLTDRQEVKVYLTNPTIKDTDADGFSDGDEVRHFYNPNGSGKLITVPNAIEKLQSQ